MKKTIKEADKKEAPNFGGKDLEDIEPTGDVEQDFNNAMVALRDDNYEAFVDDLNTLASDPKIAFLRDAIIDQFNSPKGVKVYFSKNQPLEIGNIHPTQHEVDMEKSLEFPLKTRPEMIDIAFSGKPISIKNLPLVVAEVDGTYYIIDGHHRWSQIYCMNPNAQMVVRIIKSDMFKNADDVLKLVQMQLFIAKNGGKLPQATVDSPYNLYTIDEKAFREWCQKTMIDEARQKFDIYIKDKDPIDHLWGNVVKMREYAAPTPNAHGRGDMPQTDKVEGEYMKPTAAPVSETTKRGKPTMKRRIRESKEGDNPEVQALAKKVIARMNKLRKIMSEWNIPELSEEYRRCGGRLTITLKAEGDSEAWSIYGGRVLGFYVNCHGSGWGIYINEEGRVLYPDLYGVDIEDVLEAFNTFLNEFTKSFNKYIEREEKYETDSAYTESTELTCDMCGFTSSNKKHFKSDGDKMICDMCRSRDKYFEDKEDFEKYMKKYPIVYEKSEDDWFGIPDAKFIYHGDWSDPEVIYRGISLNYYDIEEGLLGVYREDHPEDRNDKGFDRWMKKNPRAVECELELLYDAEMEYRAEHPEEFEDDDLEEYDESWLGDKMKKGHYNESVSRLKKIDGKTIKEWYEWLEDDTNLGCCCWLYVGETAKNHICICMGWHDDGDDKYGSIAWKVGLQSFASHHGPQTLEQMRRTNFDTDFDMPCDPETGDVCDTLSNMDFVDTETFDWDGLADEMNIAAQEVCKFACEVDGQYDYDDDLYNEGWLGDKAKAGWEKVKTGAKKVGKAIGDTFKGPFRKGDHVKLSGEDGESFKGTITGWDLDKQTYQVMLGNPTNEDIQEEGSGNANAIEREINTLWNKLNVTDDQTLSRLICRCIDLERIEPGRMYDSLKDYANF